MPFLFRDYALRTDTRSKIIGLLSDCRPRSFSEIVRETELGRKAVEGVLYRLWKEGKILRG
ncbi:MAG: ArsR family transcriptional regulator, partial [Candidatus Asgardarchaeia archaeon]